MMNEDGMHDGMDDSETGFIEVRDAFQTDRMLVERSGRGSETSLKRHKVQENECKLGNASDKISMYREHYRFLENMFGNLSNMLVNDDDDQMMYVS